VALYRQWKKLNALEGLITHHPMLCPFSQTFIHSNLIWGVSEEGTEKWINLPNLSNWSKFVGKISSRILSEAPFSGTK